MFSISSYLIIFQVSNGQRNISNNNRNKLSEVVPDFDRSTVYIANERGYFHTGSDIGTSYRPTHVDPRFVHRPNGNDKPQALNYYTSYTNLLLN